MFKTDVVRRVAQETRLSQREVADALNGTLRVISHALREGKKVTFPGFGTFYTSNRGEGTVRHIRTGHPMKVPARRVAGFRVGDGLKQSVRSVKAEKPAKRSRLGFIRGIK